jgi:competence ComEA-like helix-hairpin-helix protein
MLRMKKIFLGIEGLLFLFVFVSAASAEKWSQRYIGSLPDSAFAVVEISKEGKKIRHLPHHNDVGEVDIPHLKSALGRIYQVKWIDSKNFVKAKTHLEEHYQVYKEERGKALGLKGPVNINKASIKELMQLPHIGEKRALSIIEYRDTHGSFKTISELRRIPGISSEIYKDIEDLVTIE